MDKNVSLSIIIPCLNEKEAIGICVQKAKSVISSLNLIGEVLVVDNNSTDKSAEIARTAGAKIISEKRPGYGRACHTGFIEAKGDIFVMGDGDNTYDFLEIPQLIKPIQDGIDIVIGSRLKGNVIKGSMPWTHRYIGTPILSFLLRLFFGGKVVDSQSGFRAMTRKAYERLKLITTGMEFASELTIQGLANNLKIIEVPISYYPRMGQSKLNSTRDAWRHVRLMFLYSPNYLYIFPGIVLLGGGFFIMLSLLRGPLILFGHFFDIHYLIAGSLMTLTGYQILTLGIYTKIFSRLNGFYKDNFASKLTHIFNLERGIILGSGIFILGLIFGLVIIFTWIKLGFGPLNEIRLGIFASVLMLIGIQTIFSSFFLSMIGLADGGE